VEASRYKSKPLLARPFIALRVAAQGLAAAWRHEIPFRMEVVAFGQLTVYPARGEMHLTVTSLDARGDGLWRKALEETRVRLDRDGLLAAARKRALPPSPRCVGMVTSPDGAALRDVIAVVRRRAPHVTIVVSGAAVQGATAPREICDAIARLVRWGGADVIIVGRGGGAREDLWAFNDEGVARAIAACPVPVISAVGHEIDVTIADFVADLRAPTPSAAAEIITAAQHRIEDRIAALDARVLRAARYHLVLARQRLASVSIPAMRARLESLLGRRVQRLDDLIYRLESAAARRLRTRSAQLAQVTARLARHNPAARLALTRRRLDRANDSLRRLAQKTMSTHTMRLARAATRLHALSPLAVLDRGYALVFDSGGHLLRDAANAQPGDAIRARLARGTIAAKVTESSE